MLTSIGTHVRIALVVVSTVIGISGAGWGWLKSQEAAGAAQQVSDIAKELAAEKTALRAARASAGALAVRLKAAEKLTKEKTVNDALDQAALVEAKEWASTALPEPVRLRLLDNPADPATN